MLTAFIAWLLTYRYLVLFPIAVIEGPIIAIISGSLAANGQLNFLAAYFVIVTGDLMGDSFYYLLGRWGRTHVVPRLGKYVGLTESRARQVDMHYERHAGKTLFFGKLAFSLEVPMIISAGMVRYPYVRFIVFMTLAALPKTLGLMLLGYFFGFSFESARHDLAYATHISLVALLVLACVIVVVRVSRRQLAVRTSKSHKD